MQGLNWGGLLRAGTKQQLVPPGAQQRMLPPPGGPENETGSHRGPQNSRLLWRGGGGYPQAPQGGGGDGGGLGCDAASHRRDCRPARPSLHSTGPKPGCSSTTRNSKGQAWAKSFCCPARRTKWTAKTLHNGGWHALMPRTVQKALVPQWARPTSCVSCINPNSCWPLWPSLCLSTCGATVACMQVRMGYPHLLVSERKNLFFLAQTKMSWRSLLTSQYSRKGKTFCCDAPSQIPVCAVHEGWAWVLVCTPACVPAQAWPGEPKVLGNGDCSTNQ